DGRLLRAAYFMPLRAEDESGPSRPEPAAPAGVSRTVSAPWAGWFDRRRPRLSWLGFSQSLALFGFLRGLGVHLQNLEGGQTGFPVSDPATGAWCSLGNQQWHVSEENGLKLGRTLWQAFLDAGGPWPTEYRLLASPKAPLPPSDRSGYERQGPMCRQRWELI